MKCSGNTFLTRLLLLAVCLTLPFTTVFGQGGNAIWYFGQYAGVDFNTDPPTVLNNGAMATMEGCATITTAQGNLLMYTDGVKVYNRLHQQMPNGYGLLGNFSSTQSAIIVPQPGNDSIFYIFTTSLLGSGPLCYSIVNINLQNGLGDITDKNIVLHNPSGEQLNAVHHANGIDYWVIARTTPGNVFTTYLVNSSGVGLVPVTSVGIFYSLGHTGQLKFSPDGSRVAYPYNGIFLYGFNDSTGVLSNPVHISYFANYGVEFSPSGRYLYATNASEINQWDLSLPNMADISASRQQIVTIPDTTEIYYGLQLASNGKIYAATEDTMLAAIHFPENPGLLCGLERNAIILAPNTSSNLGLPTSVQSYIYQPISIQAQNFCAGSPTQFSAFSTGQIQLQNHLWDFGDPAPGAANTSTDSLPSHTYSAPGNYTVTLVGSVGNSVRTQKLQIQILASPAATVLPPGPVHICAGESVVLQAAAQPAVTYNWVVNGQPVASDTLQDLTVAATGNYQVLVSDSVCASLSDTVQVNAHPEVIATLSPEGQVFACSGQSTQLQAGPTAGNTYQWLLNQQAVFGATAPEIDAYSNGHYQVIISSDGFCGDTSETATLTLYPLPNVSAIAEYGPHCTNAVTLTASGAESYYWHTGATGPVLLAYPAAAKMYSVTGQSADGCERMVTIMAEPLPCETEITIPNIITPNNDGQNDAFTIPLAGQEYDLRIFNRWGKTVYEQKNYHQHQNWNAANLPDGVYFYHLTTSNGPAYKGWVEVVR